MGPPNKVSHHSTRVYVYISVLSKLSINIGLIQQIFTKTYRTKHMVVLICPHSMYFSIISTCFTRAFIPVHYFRSPSNNNNKYIYIYVYIDIYTYIIIINSGLKHDEHCPTLPDTPPTLQKG